MHKLALWTLVLASLWNLSCSSASKNEEGQMTFEHLMTTQRFETVMENNTRSAKSYDGFMNNYQFAATLHSTDVIDALSWKKAVAFQWNQEKYVQERKKMEEAANTTTQVFLSFYTPYSESDNLHTGKSIWKVYLQSGSNRYEGQIEKLSDSLFQLQSLYSNHTRFNTPYLVTFKVPTVVLQQSAPKLMITSPLGSSEVSWE